MYSFYLHIEHCIQTDLKYRVYSLVRRQQMCEFSCKEGSEIDMFRNLHTGKCFYVLSKPHFVNSLHLQVRSQNVLETAKQISNYSFQDWECKERSHTFFHSVCKSGSSAYSLKPAMRSTLRIHASVPSHFEMIEHKLGLLTTIQRRWHITNLK